MFRNCKTTTEQGSVGEARAIYEYTRLGYIVAQPLNDKAKYDLLIDTGTQILRVQVKTTCAKVKRGVDCYKVKISSSYANRNSVIDRTRQDGDYDVLFILTVEGDCWSIPVDKLDDKRSQVTVGPGKYEEFKIGG